MQTSYQKMAELSLSKKKPTDDNVKELGAVLNDLPDKKDITVRAIREKLFSTFAEQRILTKSPLTMHQNSEMNFKIIESQKVKPCLENLNNSAHRESDKQSDIAVSTECHGHDNNSHKQTENSPVCITKEKYEKVQNILHISPALIKLDTLPSKDNLFDQAISTSAIGINGAKPLDIESEVDRELENVTSTASISEPLINIDEHLIDLNESNFNIKESVVNDIDVLNISQEPLISGLDTFIGLNQLISGQSSLITHMDSDVNGIASYSNGIGSIITHDSDSVGKEVISKGNNDGSGDNVFTDFKNYLYVKDIITETDDDDGIIVNNPKESSEMVIKINNL